MTDRVFPHHPVSGVVVRRADRSTRPAESTKATLHWVGAGGVSVEYHGPVFKLGVGRPRGVPDTGLRAMVFDFCFGYVSGFPVRDILYYLATRDVSRRVARFIITREMRRSGYPSFEYIKHGDEWIAQYSLSEVT